MSIETWYEINPGDRGVILDTRNDGKTGLLLLANPGASSTTRSRTTPAEAKTTLPKRTFPDLWGVCIHLGWR